MSKILKTSWPILAILVLLGIIFWPFFLGFTYVANGMVYSDFWQFNYPLKDWYRQKLLSGEFPFWTSLVGNGFPVFAEGQIGALYPWHLLLFRFLPTAAAFNLNVIIHYFIAIVGSYVFIRISLKQSQWASLLGGLSFGLSGYFFTHILFFNTLLVVSYLPLVFLAVERLAVTGKVKWLFFLSLIFSLQILAGYVELFYYVLFASLVFLILLQVVGASFDTPIVRPLYIKQVLLFSVAVMLAGAITLVQIVPTLEMIKNSNRAGGFDINYASSSRWPVGALKMFVYPKAYEVLSQREYHPLDRNFVSAYSLYGYLGILPLIFALVAIIFIRKRPVVIFAVLLLLAFIYGSGRSTQIFNILWEVVPGLKSLRFPVKILFLIEFCLAVLAALGFGYILDRIKGITWRKINYLTHVLAAVLIVITFTDVYTNNAGRFRKLLRVADWLQQPLSVNFLKPQLADGMWRYYSTNTNNLYQATFELSGQREFQNLLPVDFNLLYGLSANREYFALFLQNQTRLNDFKGQVDFAKNSLRFPDEFYRSLALQSVKYILSDLPLESDRLTLVETIPFSKPAKHSVYLTGEALKTEYLPVKAVNIYELKPTYPRVSFVGQARTVTENQEALALVLADGFDPETTVVLDAQEAERDLSRSPRYTANLLKDSENQLTLEVETGQPGYLVLTDTYYPGWQAEVDGQRTKIYRANYNFRAVKITPGSHQVEFKYQPRYWQLISAISAAAAAITILGLLITVKYNV